MHDFSLPTLLSSLSSVTGVSSSSRGTLWYILRAAVKSLLKYASNVCVCLDNLIYPSIKTWLETITFLWVCLNLHCSDINSLRKTKARFWFCISYFLAMMKYYDQGNLYKKEFNLTFGSRGLEFIMLGTAWQHSRKLTAHILSHEHKTERLNWKWHEAFHLKAHVIFPSASLHLSNSVANWGHVQIPDSMGDIFHSNHQKCFIIYQYLLIKSEQRK